MQVLPRLICLLLLLVTCTYSDTPKSILKGKVMDTNGAAVEGAKVYIHWDPSGSKVGLKSNVGTQQEVMVVTGQDGAFSVEPPPGFYDVFVSAMAFSPNCIKVRTRGAQTTIVPALKLKVDPLVIRELGDQVFASPRK